MPSICKSVDLNPGQKPTTVYSKYRSLVSRAQVGSDQGSFHSSPTTRRPQGHKKLTVQSMATHPTGPRLALALGSTKALISRQILPAAGTHGNRMIPP